MKEFGLQAAFQIIWRPLVKLALILLCIASYTAVAYMAGYAAGYEAGLGPHLFY